MSIELKPINQQVIFITGATSGIGLATVRMAVDQGAKVFMVARNEDELQNIQTEMRLSDLPTAYAVADVAEIDQLQLAADHCIETFGRIDTWINNAGISVYGKLLDTSDEEAKRMFDTNFWGVVNGCKLASDLMRMEGGAIINIGSSFSEISLPLQGVYSASKHAVRSYTDSLREELLAENAPISVSLVKPGAIDSPHTLHATSHIGESVHALPVYHPDVVAKMILKCATTQIRELGIGSAAVIFPFFENIFPRLKDMVLARRYTKLETTNPEDAKPVVKNSTGNVSGNYEGHVMKTSLTSEVVSNKWLSNGLVIGGLTLLFLKRKRFI
jgi:short-subunit dehydrogenase